MNKNLNSIVVRSLALLLAAAVTFGQASAQDRVAFRQAELDQMLAPVALYPDPLLSQILMASTYPLEVVQAARWSRANPGLEGQDAVQAVESREWDPSVKSLTAFPQILAMMDEKLDWTERLGEAFLAQQADVMDSVQALRLRAEAAGNLRSNEQMRVTRQGEAIVIRQPAPEIVYVPYYDPVVVYGPWLWPAYPPVYWAPPRAYYVVPAHRPAFLWGHGIAISLNFFFGQPDWHRRHVTVVHPHHTTIVNRSIAAANVRPAVWRHDPAHRRGVPFRNAGGRQRFEQSRVAATPVNAVPVRRAVPSPAIDTRQRLLEERRRIAQERRPPEPLRAAPNTSSASNRPSVNRDVERAMPASRPEARRPQPETRPQVRAPQTGERRVDRGAAPRQAARSVEPRPTPAVARPAPRAEPRANGQAAQPSPVRASAMRAAPTAPRPAPRAVSNQQRNDRAPRGRDS